MRKRTPNLCLGVLPGTFAAASQLLLTEWFSFTGSFTAFQAVQTGWVKGMSSTLGTARAALSTHPHAIRLVPFSV